MDSAFSLGSTALTNFQRACCILIPSGVSLSFALYLKTIEEQQLQMFQGWIISQLLILIYYYIDTGVQTCGLDFHFDNPNEDEETATEDNPDDNPYEDVEMATADSPDDNTDDNPGDNPGGDKVRASADIHEKGCLQIVQLHVLGQDANGSLVRTFF